jgi:hypothetical protein
MAYLMKSSKCFLVNKPCAFASFLSSTVYGTMFSNCIIEPYRKGTDKMINRDKSPISPINRG